MINSRKIEDLHTKVHALVHRFIDECAKSHIDILITSTYRDFDSQAALYAIGRTVPGQPCSCGGKINKIGTCKKHPLGLKVTNAKAGQSFHNYRVAFDVVPLVNGKPVWNNDNLWKSIGAVGKACGLEWAGNWKQFKEYPHFQYTGGLTLSDFQKGKQLKEV